MLATEALFHPITASKLGELLGVSSRQVRKMRQKGDKGHPALFTTDGSPKELDDNLLTANIQKELERREKFDIRSRVRQAEIEFQKAMADHDAVLSKRPIDLTNQEFQEVYPGKPEPGGGVLRTIDKEQFALKQLVTIREVDVKRKAKIFNDLCNEARTVGYKHVIGARTNALSINFSNKKAKKGSADLASNHKPSERQLQAAVVK